MEKYIQFEHLSTISGLGIMILDVSGQTLFTSSAYKKVTPFLEALYEKLECEESCRVAFLFACYQARRFGGKYVFFAPSGLTYCAAPLLDSKGKMSTGVIAGPFLMVDYDDYIEYEVLNRADFTAKETKNLWESVVTVPNITPQIANAICEHHCYVAANFFSGAGLAASVPVQTDIVPVVYPVEKENELLSAISKGDIHTANIVLEDMIKQMMLHYGGNIEVLRSRVVELTVLLSRASLKGGADINAILGLNYDYLREIDSFSSIEDIILWLQTVSRQFTQHVFDFSGKRYLDIIHKAVDYIQRNYASKLTLKEISGHLFISHQYFCRIFKEATGQTPGSYITFVRIEESKKLLRNYGVKIIDIPTMVGFENQSYFTKIFKKETGYTPGLYRRKSLRDNQANILQKNI